MGLLLIRDDDPNATTDPERLARAYDPLLQANIPISFSVIPDVALDTLAPSGQREKFLNDATPSSAETQRLLSTSPLAVWLRQNRDKVDVLQHGFDHRRVRNNTEFGALNYEEATERLATGKRILQDALGALPSGFVAPWDALSADSLRASCEAYPVVSTGWVNRQLLPASSWAGHVWERAGRREVLRVKQAWVLRHRGGKIHDAVNVDDVPAQVKAITKGARVGVLVLHHWMFWQSREPHPVIKQLAATLQRVKCVPASQVPAELDLPPGKRRAQRNCLASLSPCPW